MESYVMVESETLALFLGIGLIVTGFVSVSKGRTWVNSHGGWKIRTVVRSEDPILFWIITVFLYWVFGSFFVVCSIVFSLQQSGYFRRLPFE